MNDDELDDGDGCMICGPENDCECDDGPPDSDDITALLVRADNSTVRVTFSANTTEPREIGCECQWEAGDSPCPLHGEEEVEELRP